MVQEFRGVKTTVSLGDVGRHRNGGPTHLPRKAITFLFGKRHGDLIAKYREIHCLLPYQQLTIVLSCHVTDPRKVLGISRPSPLLSCLSARHRPFSLAPRNPLLR